jgi:lysophospholipase L1-like esterase
MHPSARIVELNRWLRDYARQHELGFIDYHAALADAAGGFQSRLSNDGVHPNRDGYAIMRRLAEAALPSRPWVTAWATAQQLARPARAVPSPVTVPERIADQTVRMTARMTVAGSSLRIALSNSFGLDAVRLQAVDVARPGAAPGTIAADSTRAVTFGGRPEVVLPPGAQVTSDPVDLAVENQDDVVVSLFVGKEGAAPTAHPLGLRAAWLAPGNQVAAAQLAGGTQFRSYLWLAGVDVRAVPAAATIIAFGDSITDGYATTPDADTPWPSLLARRLASEADRPPRAVINVGISGNRILREGAGSSALARFDRDVLSRPGVRWVLLLEGINDISFSAIPNLPATEKATTEDLIAGYRLLIARARSHGLRVIGGTLTPYEGVPTYTDAGERMRGEINAWIRSSGEFDAVIDFDAAVRDPQHPARLLERFDSGDHIHPNDAGNEAMAAAVDLDLFR